MVKLMLAVAVVFAAAAGLIWAAFLRRVPTQQTIAEIKTKTFKPAGTYWQQQVGTSRGFRTAIPISVAESYVLELYSQELDATGFFSVPPADEGSYSVGQRVRMEYQRKGLPLIGYKTTVLSVGPAAP
jgi:hypothetical protein